MTFNKRIDRLESGQDTPTSPNDEVIWVDTNNNAIKRYNEDSSSWVSLGGSTENVEFSSDLTLTNAGISSSSGPDGQMWGIYFENNNIGIGDVFRISEVPITEGVDINGDYTVDWSSPSSFTSQEFDTVFGDLAGFYASSWGYFDVEIDQYEITISFPSGATGSFTTDTHSVTVINGLITDITSL